MSEFDKIIGYEKEKKELLQICDILKRIEKYKEFGVSVPKGVLFEGVPGIGKTLMAWALIKESGWKCFHVKKDKPDDEFLKEITQVFEDAKNNAPAIIFFDDMDKFSERRSRHDDNQREFVAIQTGMETIKHDNVMIVATANDIDIMPESLKRSGRFDKIMQIQPPKFDDACKIVEHYLKDKKVSKDVKAEEIVKMMDGSTCADLEMLLNKAGIYAVYEGASKIEYSHVARAIANVLFHVNVNEDFSSRGLSGYRTAVHEAGHAIMAMLLGSEKPAIVSACVNDSDRGVCITYDVPNDYSRYESCENHIMCAFAGRVAENLIFKDYSIGSMSDNKKAYDMIERFVMDEAIYGFDFSYYRADWDKRVVNSQLEGIAKVVNIKMTEYYEKVKSILLDFQEEIEKLAELIAENGFLSVRELDEFEKKYIQKAVDGKWCTTKIVGYCNFLSKSKTLC